jgi:gliding motility-associated-like protein
MIKRILFFSAILLPLLVEAQVPTRVVGDATSRRTPCAGNSAGTINRAASGPVNSNQSNDPVFLCGGDAYNIVHNGDYLLKSDGNAVSDSGIVYIIYECPPTADGPDQAAIEADPCLEIDHNATSPIVVVDPVFIGSNGSGTLVNNGSMQSFFNSGANGGGGGPINLYLAPATIDDYSSDPPSWTGSGACVSVSPNEAINLVFLNPITATPTMNNCSGSFTISGGFPEYEPIAEYTAFNITNKRTSEVITDFDTGDGHVLNGETVTFNVNSPDVYEVIIQDGKSCDYIFEMDFSGCVFDALNVVVTPAVISNCGGVQGFTKVDIQGGIPPYIIEWQGPSAMNSFQMDEGVNNLPLPNTPGNYSITITDNNGNGTNVYTETFEYRRMSLFSANVEFPEVKCYGDMADSITVKVLYNNVEQTIDDKYTFNWNNGATTQTIQNPAAGRYDVTVTYSGYDLCGTPNNTIPTPAQIQYTTTEINAPSCPGSLDGAIEIAPSGGTVDFGNDYTVFWYLSPDGDQVSGGSGNTTLSGVGAADYYAVITDDKGCTDTTEVFTVSDPASIQIAFTDSVAVSCAVGGCDGSALALASGGQPFNNFNYNFAWSSGESANNVANHRPSMLCGGQNTVTVTDANNCTAVGTVSIPIPAAVTFDSVMTVATSCYLDNDGQAFVQATGGAGNYTYAWSNGQTGNTATGLAAGNYIVTATDGNNCPSAPFTVAVAQPDSFVVSLASITNVTCNGQSDGTIELQTTGGNPDNLNFQWTSGVNSTTSIASELAAGTYGATVTDSKGCRDTTMATITEPTPVQMALANIDPIRCNGEFTLVQIASASGGAGEPYVYTVDGFNYVSVDTPTPVPAGNYTVTVRDINDCEASADISLTEPAPVTVDFVVDTYGQYNTGTIYTADLTGNPPLVEIDLGDSIHVTLDQAGILQGIDSVIWTSAPFDVSLCPDFHCEDVGIFSTDDVLLAATVTDTDGCTGTGEVFIEVNKKRRVFIPNAFNPDSDNFENEKFTVFTGQGVVQVKSMQVFNRWGEVVFVAKNFVPDVNAEIGWDGTFDGKKLAPGVYVYAIEVEFIDGTSLTYRGDVSLLR